MGQTDKQIGRYTDTDGEIDELTGRQTDRHTVKHSDRQKNRQKEAKRERENKEKMWHERECCMDAGENGPRQTPTTPVQSMILVPFFRVCVCVCRDSLCCPGEDRESQGAVSPQRQVSRAARWRQKAESRTPGVGRGGKRRRTMKRNRRRRRRSTRTRRRRM